MLELARNLAGLTFEHPVMLAAGMCKTLDGEHGVQELARSAVAAIMVGSITVAARSGNEGDVYYYDEGMRFSLNALGLPNPGANYYRQHLPEMVAVAHGSSKPLIVSVAGFTPDEYRLLTEVAFEGGADAVEINFGCPNVWDGGKQKGIGSFDPDLIGRVLNRINNQMGIEARILVKLSPFTDPGALVKIAQLIGSYSVVKGVTTMNTMPNAFAFAGEDHTRSVIGVGYGGMAGPAIHAFAVGQVRQLRAVLPEQVQIIGVGGVEDGKSVMDFLAVGATAVQVGTAFLQQGPRIFNQILYDLVD